MTSVWYQNLFDKHNRTKYKSQSTEAKSRKSNCRKSRPCFSEYCEACRADRFHHDVRPLNETIYLDTDTGLVSVKVPRLDKNPLITARQQFLKFAKGYSNEELVAVTINLTIIPSAQFTVQCLKAARNRLKYCLKKNFPGYWFKGVFEDSYHTVDKVSLDDIDVRTWKRDLDDRQTVMKLHIHGIMPKNELNKEEIQNRFQRTFSGSRQVRVQEIRTTKKSTSVEKLGIGGFAEYSSKREQEFDMGDELTTQPDDLVENRKILTRKRQRFEFNYEQTRHYNTLQNAIQLAHDAWISDKIYEGIDHSYEEVKSEALQYLLSYENTDNHQDMSEIISEKVWQ